jgi:hypothetical protein
MSFDREAARRLETIKNEVGALRGRHADIPIPETDLALDRIYSGLERLKHYVVFGRYPDDGP